MTILDLINNTLDSQPEGRELLSKIIIKYDDVHHVYNSCDYLQSIVHTKFDFDVLKNTGYSLQYILDNSHGIIESESHKFILTKLQEYIAKQEKEKNKQTQDGFKNDE